MSAPTFNVGAIQKTSHSLAEKMRLCMLQAGISRINEAGDYVLGSPHAWLGTAYHHVMEEAAALGPSKEGWDEWFEKVWSKSVADQCEKNRHHPLNQRFADSELWDNYNLIKAFAKLRGNEIEPSSEENTDPRAGRLGSVMEIRLCDSDGRELDACVTEEQNGDWVEYTFESRGGKKGSKSKRNDDYLLALETLLERLRADSAVIRDILVVSAKLEDLTVEDRRVNLTGKNFPIELEPFEDLRALRIEITKAAAGVGRAPDARGYGNPTRKLRITVSRRKQPIQLFSSAREKWLSSHDGKLVGQPDFYTRDEVCDYKSGNIYEAEEDPDKEQLKESIARQLRIYGYLIKELDGFLPSRGVVIPPSGQKETIDLSEQACEQEAQEAVELLDSYNNLIKGGVSVEELASPSADACKWCGYKTICPVFWEHANPEWSGEMIGGSVSGKVVEDPESVFRGEAKKLVVQVSGGTIENSKVDISPFPLEIFPLVTTLANGDQIRIVNLRSRKDVQLVPHTETILLKEAEMPQIKIISNG